MSPIPVIHCEAEFTKRGVGLFTHIYREHELDLLNHHDADYESKNII